MQLRSSVNIQYFAKACIICWWGGKEKEREWVKWPFGNERASVTSNRMQCWSMTSMPYTAGLFTEPNVIWLVHVTARLLDVLGTPATFSTVKWEAEERRTNILWNKFKKINFWLIILMWKIKDNNKGCSFLASFCFCQLPLHKRLTSCAASKLFHCFHFSALVLCLAFVNVKVQHFLAVLGLSRTPIYISSSHLALLTKWAKFVLFQCPSISDRSVTLN